MRHFIGDIYYTGVPSNPSDPSDTPMQVPNSDSWLGGVDWRHLVAAGTGVLLVLIVAKWCVSGMPTMCDDDSDDSDSSGNNQYLEEWLESTQPRMAGDGQTVQLDEYNFDERYRDRYEPGRGVYRSTANL